MIKQVSTEGKSAESANRQVLRSIYLSIFCVALVCGIAFGAEAKIGVTKPLGNDDVYVVVRFGQGGLITVANISATDTAKKKRDKILNALKADGYDAAPIGETEIRIWNLAAGTTVDFYPNKTGEKKDQVIAKDAVKGVIDPNGKFDSVDPNGDSSKFTGGVGNDSGSYSVELDSNSISDLNDTGVAAALYDALNVPNLPTGVSVNLNGSSIEVFFDSSLTETNGGKIEFGTTSISGDISGSITIAPRIPTLSVWGFITMIILMSAIGMIVIIRRRYKAAPA